MRNVRRSDGFHGSGRGRFGTAIAENAYFYGLFWFQVEKNRIK